LKTNIRKTKGFVFYFKELPNILCDSEIFCFVFEKEKNMKLAIKLKKTQICFFGVELRGIE